MPPILWKAIGEAGCLLTLIILSHLPGLRSIGGSILVGTPGSHGEAPYTPCHSMGEGARDSAEGSEATGCHSDWSCGWQEVMFLEWDAVGVAA